MLNTQEQEKQIEEIKAKLKQEQIENIYLNFVDFSGMILTKMVGVQELINNTHVSWFDGISLNGSLIKDFQGEEMSDWLVLLPDSSSFRIVPFLKAENQKTGILFCNLKNFGLDTRSILQNAVAEFQKREITPMFGTQLIYSIENAEETQYQQNYYHTYATNPNTIFHHHLVNSLLQAEIPIEYYMPYGIKHQRIDLVPDVATIAADKLFTAKWFVENLGMQQNQKISFENIPDNFISTCPVHMSLWKGEREKNLFFDETRQDELSQLGEQFINGILAQSNFIKAITKTGTTFLLKDYQPAYSTKRDDSLVQVPLYFQEKQKKDRIGWSKRCIYNGFNADGNYYLLFATILYAGLYGIEYPEKAKEKMNQLQKQKPLTTLQLCEELKNNDYLSQKLGKVIVEKAIQKLGGIENE